MMWRLALVLLSFVMAGWAGQIAAKSSPGQKIGRRATKWRLPRRPQLMILAGIVIGVFGAAGLQDRYFGWWAVPMFFIPFYLIAYVPVLLHNRAVAAGGTSSGIAGGTPGSIQQTD